MVVSRRSYQEATHDIVLAAVTSQVHDGPGDMTLRHWSEAGLLKPSWLRTGKLVTVHESLILRALGRLTPDDRNSAKEQLSVVLGQLRRHVLIRGHFPPRAQKLSFPDHLYVLFTSWWSLRMLTGRCISGRHGGRRQIGGGTTWTGGEAPISVTSNRRPVGAVEAGVLIGSGATEEARQQHLTQANNLLYGCPYLSSEENAHLWMWLHPAISVASYSLASTMGACPCGMISTIMIRWFTCWPAKGWNAILRPGGDRDLSQRWWIWECDRDQELDDSVNFFQLWVDMRTGFCRRRAAEGANGIFFFDRLPHP